MRYPHLRLGEADGVDVGLFGARRASLVRKGVYEDYYTRFKDRDKHVNQG